MIGCWELMTEIHENSIINHFFIAQHQLHVKVSHVSLSPKYKTEKQQT